MNGAKVSPEGGAYRLFGTDGTSAVGEFSGRAWGMSGFGVDGKVGGRELAVAFAAGLVNKGETLSGGGGRGKGSFCFGGKWF